MSKILVVDDQADIRLLVKWSLDVEGHDVTEASHGQAGLDAARTIKPDLILLDVMMPGDLDGLQVCLALKADAALQHIPVVMLTAGVQELEQQAARQAGANLFMAKPFSRAKLLEVVRQFLSPESAVVSHA